MPNQDAPTRRFVEILPPGLDIDFIGLRSKMLVFSAILVAGSLAALFAKPLNYGIDFEGGTMVHVRFGEATDIAVLRSKVGATEELEDMVVQDVGGDQREFQLRVASAGDDSTERTSGVVREALTSGFGEGSYDVLRVESVGPKVGGDLWRDATLAVVAATLMMGIYLAVRFDFRFGLGAAAALLHDVIITLGALAISATEFNLTTVAALLTVIGFSVNDTVVISDRIRENVQARKRDPLPTVVNASINETMSRTLITSGTAVFVILALFFLGGTVIHSFAFTLLIGFIVGTYSSIYIAAPVVLSLEGRVRTPVGTAIGSGR